VEDFMSRLDDECVMAVVRNRSGESAGEIDMDLFTERFEKLCIGDLDDVLITLNTLSKRCMIRKKELKKNRK
jgi:hypothetical protein